MSDSLPENSISGVLRVLKLISGEEIIALVNESISEKITLKLPAKLDSYYGKDENNNKIEFIKLTNYLNNIKGYEVDVNKNSILYMGSPNIQLEKMYEIYFVTMQTDPNAIISSGQNNSVNPEHGLKLLNELFNNDDFVGFVNDLIENYEGVEILSDIDDSEEDLESNIGPLEEEEPEPQPKPKKRNKAKPEGNKLPYEPDGNPNSPESWSDNPSDYI